MVIYFEQVSAEQISCFINEKEISIIVEDVPSQLPDLLLYRNQGSLLKLPIPKGARCHIQGSELSVEHSNCIIDFSLYKDISVDVFYAVGTSSQTIQKVEVVQIQLLPAQAKSPYLTSEIDVQVYSPEIIAMAKIHKTDITLRLCLTNCVSRSLLGIDD